MSELANQLAAILIVIVLLLLFISWTVKKDHEAAAAIDRLLPPERNWDFTTIGDTTGPVLGDFDDTRVISAVVADDVAYGVHSWRRVIIRQEPYRGKHHSRIGCLTVAALQARLGAIA